MAARSNRNVQTVKTQLEYAEEYIDSAASYAEGIKDPELTKKVKGVKDSINGVQDYLKSKTDSKTG